jgi:DnaJ-class molecular chaperone
LNINFDIDFPKKLDEDEKELLSSVLDEEEISKIEQMILKRSISENLNKLNRVSLGPTPKPYATAC